MWSSAEDARDGILSIWETADFIKVTTIAICLKCKKCVGFIICICCEKISEEEVSFLTNGEDPYDDAVVKKLIHPNLKLLLVTEGPDGCRYYSKVILRTSDLYATIIIPYCDMSFPFSSMSTNILRCPIKSHIIYMILMELFISSDHLKTLVSQSFWHSLGKNVCR